MNTTIVTLLCAPLLVTGLAAQGANQGTEQPKVGSRRLVDVSVEGLTAASRQARDDTASGGSLGLTGPGLPLDCLERIVDQATNACVMASSTPTMGMLCPYPGLNNAVIPQAFVGGGENNQATGFWAMIGGGYNNTATEKEAVVAGGRDNLASAEDAAIGGGSFNTASGAHATVGGGWNNTSRAMYTTVGGGSENLAAGNRSTIAGGWKNVAYGGFAMIAGGRANAAVGDHSFAAGRRAKANHLGAFVWGDSENVDKTSSKEDQFNVYARGGARFVTRIGAHGNVAAGVVLAPGGSTWSSVSDRNSKENVEPVDGRAVLERLASIPLATWNYKAQDDSIRHMGPMAQDFYAAFGLGLGDKTIDTIDPDGVALAAIQGLNDLVEEKNQEIEELRARVDRLEALLAK